MAEAIKVAVRVRPLVESEKDRGCAPCIETPDNNEPQIIVSGGEKVFTFNYVFNEEATQQDVYEVAVQSLVYQLFKGYNVTVFAYGQTGSGKTHTMGTNFVAIDGENLGVIPRAVQDIFRYIEANRDWEIKVEVSFMELYKEQMYDLLASERVVVELREGNKGVYIPGLTQVSVTSTLGVMQCLQNGSFRRVTGATNMNQNSSRSHAIFTLSLQQQRVDDPNQSTSAKFHLVDLAGSERTKKTGAEGERFKEGVQINAGLLALGNVISALGEGKQVPSYRNSKLTRLLQDSLGGNSYTLMIACISPADYNLLETVNTLRYADRARKIKNKPMINQDPKSAEIAALKKKVNELQLQLASVGGTVIPMQERNEVDVRRLEIENKELRGKVRALMERQNDALSENATIREKLLVTENNHDRIRECLDQMETNVLSHFENFENIRITGNVRHELASLRTAFLADLESIKSELDRYETEQSDLENVNDELHMTYSIEKDDQEDDLEIVEQEEEHVNKQMQLNRELRELSKNLQLKQRVRDTYVVNGKLLKDTEQQRLQYEKQITILEKEKDELIASIKQLQAANKDLECKEKQSQLAKKNSEIDLLRRKVAEQGKIVKQKEEAEKKCAQLLNEITQMKQAKVRLVREMKSEGERWRAWRLDREKETAKLRDQDRKYRSEIERMKTFYAKQQIVSKRKLEEAVAANKRLKEALNVQQTARNKREMRGGAKEQVRELVNREMEILMSWSQAEHTLNTLMEDRAALTGQMTELRRMTIDKARQMELNAIERDIEVRSAQITDLQKKIVECDELKEKIKKWEGITSISDAKTALNFIMEITVEKDKEVLRLQNSLAEMETVKEQHCKIINDMRNELMKQKETLQQELLIREDQHQKVLNELLVKENISDVLETTQRELESKSEECSVLQKQLDLIVKVSNVKPTRKRHSIHREFEDVTMKEDGTYEGENVEVDDVIKDPDWRNTPIHKKLQALRENRRTNRKRNISTPLNISCLCTSGCTGVTCICFKLKAQCSEACGCIKHNCNLRDNVATKKLKL